MKEDTLAPNPLLALDGAVAYGRVRAEHVLPAVGARLEAARGGAERILAETDAPTWEGLIGGIDALEEGVERAWRPAEHLGRVRHDESLRQANREAKAQVAAWRAELAQDQRYYRAATGLRAREPALGDERRRVLDVLIRELRLGGVHLSGPDRDRCREIRVELDALATRFAESATDSADSYRLVLDDPGDVASLPASVRDTARAQALRDDPQAPPDRWSFILQPSSLNPFLTHQADRALRERIYRAFCTVATEGAHDNGPTLARIVALRLELARLLGYDSFAAVALESEMAGRPETARRFLEDLAARARPAALRERAELDAMAAAEGLDDLQRYDIARYRERCRKERYGYSELEVRQYFPFPRVLDGLCQVIGRLFGVVVTGREAAGDPRAWHPSLRLLEIREPGGSLLAEILLDPYLRPGKHRGAWMSGAILGGRRASGAATRPLGIVCCNFPQPEGERPSLLSHDNVRTLFHELGHALHHSLTEVNERRCAGTRGVPRDGVELPSRFLENWVWQPEALALVSGHVETGEPLPEALLGRLLAARNLLRATDMMRQIEVSLFDLELHAATEPTDAAGVRALLASVRERVAVVPAPPYDRFENNFHHIFSGGYASSYYGYAWADVLAADAFSRFEAEGVWSQAAAGDFRRHILARGGSADLMDLYVAYRGRRPDPDALLRQCGLLDG